MDDKYYTPEISDLFVGMECEWKSKDGFLPTTLNTQQLFEIMLEETFEEKRNWSYKDVCRIKHLDKSDIESLGWKEKILDNNSGYFTSGDYTLGYHDSTHNNILKCFCHISKREGEFNIAIFNGTIKNKAELAKIMKQVGITK